MIRAIFHIDNLNILIKEDIFFDERGPKLEILKCIIVILKDEIEAAMKRMKGRKASGPDNSAVGLIEALGNWCIDRVTEILNEIHKSGEMPN